MSKTPDTVEAEAEAPAPTLTQRAATLVREHPKTAIAAGAIAAAGVAAAIPLARRRGSTSGGKPNGSGGRKAKKG